jgi:hypothetical protein
MSERLRVSLFSRGSSWGRDHIRGMTGDGRKHPVVPFRLLPGYFPSPQETHKGLGPWAAFLDWNSDRSHNKQGQTELTLKESGSV